MICLLKSTLNYVKKYESKTCWDTALKTCKRPPKYIKIPIFSTTSKAKTRLNNVSFQFWVSFIFLQGIAKYPGTQFLSVPFVTASGAPFLLGKPWGCPRFQPGPFWKIVAGPSVLRGKWFLNSWYQVMWKSWFKTMGCLWFSLCVPPSRLFWKHCKFSTHANLMLPSSIEIHAWIPSNFFCGKILKEKLNLCDQKSMVKSHLFDAWGHQTSALIFTVSLSSLPRILMLQNLHISGWWFQLYTYPVLKNHGVSSSVGMMTFPIWWESHKSHVPNHQPEVGWTTT